MKLFITLLTFCFLSTFTLQAQDATPLIKRYLLDNQQKYQLSKEDAAEGWVLSDQYLSPNNAVTQVYVQQMINGLKLYNAVSTAAVKDGAVVVFNSRFTPNAARLANTLPGMERLSARDAVIQASKHLEIPLVNLTNGKVEATVDKFSIFTSDGIVKQPIKVSLLYQKTDEDIRLAWNVEIQAKSDWWHVRVDAVSGEILDKGNYTVYCNFYHDAYGHPVVDNREIVAHDQNVETPNNALASYRVFPFPGESPNHVSRQLISDPSDPVASPFGWHDIDGQPGPEFTITRGNNVYASEDRDADNIPGHSPDGGPNLLFDFPYVPTQAPIVWEDAAITNLFYANNFMHDMTYHHGFNEAAGNYQENNYGHGGQDSDPVQADAQDGSGTDNANFSAPSDGQSGRMQMYIWTGSGPGGSGDSLRVNSPAGIAGLYYSPAANFGPIVTAPITSNVVFIEDNTAPTSDGCETIVNGALLNGKIAVIDRGVCGYTVKVQKAQDAGAIAVIVVNNSAAGVFSMPGSSPTITIPSVMISQADGLAIRTQIANGPVNITLIPKVVINYDKDSDLDNGIMAHEYGHGISIRLTGGPSNSGCLDNAEQMGEGWSDFYSLITTMHPTDTRTTPRPVGTYALSEPTTGQGIRNKIYSTDMSVNSYTYGNLAGTGGEVHDIGELWATMLWDLTWDLIDQYGFEPNLMLNTGGNNIAQQLVTDGFKLQPCSPGFQDGRDAILLADKMDFNGANQCLIWKAFARRGLGYSAKQGSSDSYSDGTEAFDIPPLCQIAVSAPIAAFSADRTSSCVELGTIKFTDETQNIAQYWLWDFGDGTTSTETNPVHTYTAPGTYTVSLSVTNNIASDTVIKSNYIAIVTLPAPSVSGATVCAGSSAALTVTPSTSGNTAEWSDSNGNVVYTGTTFNTPNLLSTTTYAVREGENAPIQKVGPTTFGPGGNHNTSFVAEELFTAEKAFTIISVLVRAQGAGNREIRLYDASDNVINALTVNVPNGDSRVTLNFKVPGPGKYGLGAGPMVNLYRNTGGATYPYAIPGLVSITGSNSGQGVRFYYFYDWAVQETSCRSNPSNVTVTVTPGPVGNFTSVVNGLTASFENLSSGNPSSILWNFGDGSTSTQNNPSHTYATLGVFDVSLTVSDGNCTNVFHQTLNFTSATTSLTQDRFSAELKPNPATDMVHLSIIGTPGSRFVQVGLYSADGRLVISQRFDTLQGSNIPIDLNGLASGLYVVKIEAAAGLVMKKLVVE